MKKLQIIATTTFFGFAAIGQISYANPINSSSAAVPVNSQTVKDLADYIIRSVKDNKAADDQGGGPVAHRYKQAKYLVQMMTKKGNYDLTSISPQTCIQQVETLLNGAKQYHQSTYSDATINSAMHVMELSSGLLYTGAYFADGCQTMQSITYNAAYLMDKAMELIDQNYRG
ncbi:MULTISPECIES: hypothetical protein [Cysteiniphilum]|uniref:hypothetical protein n=1 Tax=Cysteiniphilum TaxID=2056696 RepID=UPI00177B80BB|nr:MULTISPECIES: hypothetical protein [Cysteiniphilum]